MYMQVCVYLLWKTHAFRTFEQFRVHDDQWHGLEEFQCIFCFFEVCEVKMLNYIVVF